MAKPSNPPCVEYVYQRELRSSFPCGHNGKVERAGRWFCGRHDPQRLAAAQAVRDEQYRQEQEAKRAAWAKAEQRHRDIERVMRWVAKWWSDPNGGCKACGAWGDIVCTCPAGIARAIVAELDAERAP